MSELNLVSPLLDGLKLQAQFSDRGRAKCYSFERSETGEQFVVKHISIPGSDAKTQALILTGAVADEAGANEYYRELTEDLRIELDVLQALSGGGLTGYQIVPRETIGFDVYMLMPRKSSLRSYLQDNAITQLQALNLGLDLCDVMGEAQRNGFSYLNLKPENVFVDSRKRFSIGDIGFVKLEDLAYSAVNEEYINEFSAPELSRLIPEPTRTSDLYSLGMLLFYVFNGNHMPFENEKISAQRAKEKRLSSEILPSPQYADYELAEIISKACSLNPEARHASFAELKQELTLYMRRNEVSDQLLVPPLPEQAEEKQSGAPDQPSAKSQDGPPEEAPETALDGVPVEVPEPEEAPETLQTAEQTTETAPVEEPEAVPEMILAPEPPEDSEQPPEEQAPDTLEEPDVPAEQDDEQTELPVPSDPALAEELGLSDLSDLSNIEVPEDEPPESLEEILASVSNVLSDDETVPEAPDLDANEAAVREPEPEKRKKKKWIPIVIAILILALLGAALTYFYSNWYLVTMDGLEVTDRTADSITVAYNLSSPDPDLSWDCIDTYGNSYSGIAGEGRVQFHDLEPGMQYTISFHPGALHKLIGTTTTSAATAAQTQIVSMTAVQAAVNTTAEIAIVVSGPEPEQWLLTYSSTGSDSGSVSFTGHSVEVSGLQLHDTYTFELTSPEDVYLAGQTSCELFVLADVQGKDLQVSSATSDSLTVTWESTSDPPLSWTVQCVGEGYDETQEVTECVATFPGVRLDTAYTFTVNALGMDVPMSISLPANARIVTSFQVEPMDSGTIHVSWSASEPEPEGGWVVRYQIGGDPELGGSINAKKDHDVYLTGMPANSEIVVSLEPKDGQSVIGVSTLTTETLEVVEFSDHEFVSGDTELKLYQKPEKDEWTYDDLGGSAEEYDPGTEAAVVLQAPEKFKDDDKDETMITIAIRGENGSVVQFRRDSSTWNDIWKEGKFLTTYKLPETAGSYQLELYFDGKLVNETVFSVEGEEEADTGEEAAAEEADTGEEIEEASSDDET